MAKEDFSEIVRRLHASITSSDQMAEAEQLLKAIGIPEAEAKKIRTANQPFGIVKLENPAEAGARGPTAGVTCTFDPSDGCKPDVD